MRFLAEMTWPEAQTARDRKALVLVPVGSTEAHGPHLPLATDVIISEELCRRASRALEDRGTEAVIAPALAYAVTEYAGEFAGTVTLAKDTAVALVRDVIVGLQKQGFERVVLVNSHLEPAHLDTVKDAIAAASQITGTRALFPDACSKRWARTLTEEFKKGACHAGRYESSLVLAARPELVREAVRTTLGSKPIDLSKAMKSGVKTFKEAGAGDAYFGDPALATVAHGDEIYDLLVTMVLTEIDEAAVPPGTPTASGPGR
jgi:creatinine amidohydrolase